MFFDVSFLKTLMAGIYCLTKRSNQRHISQAQIIFFLTVIIDVVPKTELIS